ncbi:MAG: hypothetical protein Q8K86_05015 [Candidatus Nanopelagicaceae bacterium]|nr:hypothetical protein [Candidatus Nanopelagicaceae bacterium]
MRINYAVCHDRMKMALISRKAIKKSPGFNIDDRIDEHGSFEVPDGTEVFFDSGFCTFVIKEGEKYVYALPEIRGKYEIEEANLTKLVWDAWTEW